MSTLIPHPAEVEAADAGRSTSIAEYGLLADCNSSALVDRGGSIDWLCLPRYDSDAIFARLLDPDAGHWSIRPAGAFSSAGGGDTSPDWSARPCAGEPRRRLAAPLPRPCSAPLPDALVPSRSRRSAGG